MKGKEKKHKHWLELDESTGGESEEEKALNSNHLVYEEQKRELVT